MTDTEKKIRIGPFTKADIERLTGKLKVDGAHFKITASNSEESEQEAWQRGISLDPDAVFLGIPKNLYIELGPDGLEAIEEDLEEMGIQLRSSDSEGNLLRDEFHCPKCDYTSDSPDICPMHHLATVKFSTWAESSIARRKIRDRAVGAIVLIGLALVAAFLLYQFVLRGV